MPTHCKYIRLWLCDTVTCPFRLLFWDREERERQGENLTMPDLSCAYAVNLEDTKTQPSQQKNKCAPL